MEVPLQDRIHFFQTSHLFQGLAEDELTKIAESLEVVDKAAGEEIFKAGDPADTFCMVYSGRVRIFRTEKSKERQLSIMVRGDYFGEGVLRKEKARRNATATAVGAVTLLTLSRENMHALTRSNPRFHKNIMVSVKSRRLAHRMRFKWVRDDETVHFVVRKHVIILLGVLVIPILIGFLGVALLIIGISTGPAFVNWVSAIVFLLAFLWGLWNWIDWSNDYYIVTNQRVVWLEKVVATYDSSLDAPLSGIRNENVETSLLGRVLDFGDLIVYTFIGRIVFQHIPHPFEARVFVQELRARVSEVARAEELQSMKTAIRSRLFPDEKAVAPPVKFSPLTAAPRQRQTTIARKAGGIFSLRFEDKDTITYRKHIFVLIKQAGIPALLSILMIALLGVLVVQWLSGGQAGSIPGLLLVWLIGFLVFFIWAVYQYVDWSNDIFQVTPTQIFDIDKTPLGEEQRRSAPLENILTIDSRRKGILQLLFNYGTVQINITGQESMAFEDVLNPTSVQQDIDRRRLASIAKKETDKAAAERDRLADFFATYYNSFEEFQKEEEERKRRSGVQ